MDAAAGLDAYLPVNDLFTEKTQSRLSGSGTIRFSSPLIGQDMAFKLSGSLDALQTSYIGVVFYSNNLTVTNNSGIEVRFTRDNAGVLGDIIVRSAISAVTSPRMNFYFPASLDVIIQVKNASNGARVVVWRRDSVTYSLATADFDSADSTTINPTLPNYGGLGNFIGITMNFATVTGARVISPVLAL